MRRSWKQLAAGGGIGMLLAAGMPALGQGVPSFYGTGAVAFEPEIGFVHTGVMVEARGIVSPDRKYVTIGGNATEARVLAFDEFNFQRLTGLGYVGGVQFTESAGSDSRAGNWTGSGGAGGTVQAAGARGGPASVLNREGMTRLK